VGPGPGAPESGVEVGRESLATLELQLLVFFPLVWVGIVLDWVSLVIRLDGDCGWKNTHRMQECVCANGFMFRECVVISGCACLCACLGPPM